VDGAVLSVLHDVSQMPKVYAAQQALGEMGIRVLGAVLNGVDSPVESASYRYTPPAAATTDAVEVA
jgi:hypothetical protein